MRCVSRPGRQRGCREEVKGIAGPGELTRVQTAAPSTPNFCSLCYCTSWQIPDTTNKTLWEQAFEFNNHVNHSLEPLLAVLALTMHIRVSAKPDCTGLNPERADPNPDRADLNPDSADLNPDPADLNLDRTDRLSADRADQKASPTSIILQCWLRTKTP